VAADQEQAGGSLPPCLDLSLDLSLDSVRPFLPCRVTLFMAYPKFKANWYEAKPNPQTPPTIVNIKLYAK